MLQEHLSTVLTVFDVGRYMPIHEYGNVMYYGVRRCYFTYTGRLTDLAW